MLVLRVGASDDGWSFMVPKTRSSSIRPERGRSAAIFDFVVQIATLYSEYLLGSLVEKF